MNKKNLLNLKAPFKPPLLNQNIEEKAKIPANEEETKTNQKEYFRIFFSKDVKKKHKVFDEGILAISSNTCQIFNSEGAKVSDFMKPKRLNECIINEEPVVFSFNCYGS